MKNHSEPWTPHGADADRHVTQIVNNLHRALLDNGWWHPATLACWIAGSPARGEAWITRHEQEDGATWDLLDRVMFVVGLPQGFETEARDLERRLPEVELVRAANAAVEVVVLTLDSLPVRPEAHRKMIEGRRLIWSFGGRDPWPDILPGDRHALAVQAMIHLSRELAQLQLLLGDPLRAFQPAIVREAWIKTVQGLDRLGQIVLLAAGCFDGRGQRRAELLRDMGELGTAHPELAGLIQASAQIRALPRFKVPGWGDLGLLGQELVTWSRHVAHAHLGAELVSPD